MTKVVFRKWTKEGNKIVALFPAIPNDVDGYFCESYMHWGGFGGADYDGIIQNSIPATKEEYTPLLEELQQIFEDDSLKVAQRASSHDRDKRMEEARSFRNSHTEVDEPDPYFDRFDICEAHYVLEGDYNSGGWLQERRSNVVRGERKGFVGESTSTQLHRMGFKPASFFGGYEDLTENGKAIYRELVKRYGLPWEGEDA